MSLAVADFLAGTVVCGAINATYNLYFTARPFHQQQEQISSWESYLDQAYIDGFGITSVLSISASIFMLIVISLDR